MGYAQEAGDAELAAWAAARGPDEAARQLAQLLGDPDVGCRQFAVHVLHGLPSADEAVRAMLEQPVARPYARFWLEKHGVAVPERYRDPQDELLLLVETTGLMVELGAAEEALDQLFAHGDAADRVELVRGLWRVESSYTEPVLQTLAASAPPVVSKAARKALHSLRSAGRAG